MSNRPEEIRHLESEPLPRYPVIVTGATSGAGLAIARRLALNAYAVGFGARSPEKLKKATGGLSSQDALLFPFQADLTDPSQIQAAVDDLVKKGHKVVHLVHAAAGGIPNMRSLLEEMIKLQRKESISPEEAKESREKIAALLGSDKSIFDQAAAVNFSGPQALIEIMEKYGLLAPNSLVITTSSAWSDDYDPSNPDSYKGPEFYRKTVAEPKGMFVKIMEELARRGTSRYVDLVIPEITDTTVGGMLDKIVIPSVNKANPERNPQWPAVSTDEVAKAVLEIFENAPLLNPARLYLNEGGILSQQRPANWNQEGLVYPL